MRTLSERPKFSMNPKFKNGGGKEGRKGTQKMLEKGQTAGGFGLQQVLPADRVLTGCVPGFWISIFLH